MGKREKVQLFEANESDGAMEITRESFRKLIYVFRGQQVMRCKNSTSSSEESWGGRRYANLINR